MPCPELQVSVNELIWPGRRKEEDRPAALRYFSLDGTDHSSQQEQGAMIRGVSSGTTTLPTPPLPTALEGPAVPEPASWPDAVEVDRVVLVEQNSKPLR